MREHSQCDPCRNDDILNLKVICFIKNVMCVWYPALCCVRCAASCDCLQELVLAVRYMRSWAAFPIRWRRALRRKNTIETCLWTIYRMKEENTGLNLYFQLPLKTSAVRIQCERTHLHLRPSCIPPVQQTDPHQAYSEYLFQLPGTIFE